MKINSTDFQLPGQQGLYHGKVRDVYDFGNSLMFVASDRYSAFDRVLTVVENKGHLLTATSKWWFEQTASIVPNHIMSYPDPNVAWGKKYKVIPIEMIVRGFITGVTNTSLWHTYSQGQRDYGDFTLPDGLKKNDPLPQPVLTPTTKFEVHDRNLTPAEAVSDGLLTAQTWEKLQKIALELFTFGQKTANQKGLILVDTKYEFGQDDDGNIILIDEIHTQDSSRYWNANTYQTSIAAGQEPDNYDKEFLRIWYKERFDPYSTTEAPEIPEEIVKELETRYRYVYEQLTGTPFVPADTTNPLQRIESNIQKALKENT